MLAVRGLRKSFPSAKGARSLALDSLALSIDSGGCLCLLGANGSGKTTFLRILAGLVLADSGEVRLGGDTGFSPGEERSFYGRLTGYENLRFFASLRGLDKPGLDRKLAELEEPLRLNELLGTPYQQASSGMKQRLSVARALLHEPPVVLLDEPTKSLDPEGAERLRRFVVEKLKAPDRLVVWTTHQIEEAWEIGDRIAILRHGKLAVFGSPQELLDRAKTGSPKEAFRRLIREGAA